MIGKTPGLFDEEGFIFWQDNSCSWMDEHKLEFTLYAVSECFFSFLNVGLYH